jgi:hypothetical protein
LGCEKGIKGKNGEVKDFGKIQKKDDSKKYGGGRGVNIPSITNDDDFKNKFLFMCCHVKLMGGNNVKLIILQNFDAENANKNYRNIKLDEFWDLFGVFFYCNYIDEQSK